MSCTLPPEILDLIVDHLHNQPAALKACCAVSRSWVPRTRKHLFARIEYHALNPPDTFERWKNTFPDPSNSPAHYVRTLSFCGLTAATAADANTTSSWIRAFCRVVHLHVNTAGWEVTDRVSLAQLHGLSPNLKSIYLVHSSIPPSEVFNLICSFPLLEDLRFDLGFDFAAGSSTGGWVIPSTSPKLTGSLRMMGHIRSTVRQLCDLPDGLRFSKIMVWCPKEDVESIMGLVSRCSGTLESLSIYYYHSSMPGTPSLDLSKATKLKDIVFSCGKSDVRWITTTIQTATSKNLQQITVSLRPDLLDQIGEIVYQELQDLDCLLVQLWVSRSIRPNITYQTGKGERNMRWLAQGSLPKLVGRGFINAVEHC